MSVIVKGKLQSRPSKKGVVLFSAIIILFVAWSVLLFGVPPGMETGAALLLVTPFAMCIVVVEGSIWVAQYVTNRCFCVFSCLIRLLPSRKLDKRT
ncbi:MAG: hypothetical protein ACTSUZ_05110 [Candidatus Thorarchaeota archaeon]